MRSLGDTIWIETRKARRSRMPLFTALGSLFMPLGIALLIFISKNPEVSHKLGLIGAKANLMAYSATNWPTYMGLLTEVIAMAGFFLFCLIISWVFGREFSDGTLKDMLAVPVPRGSIILAKFIVVAVWSGTMAMVILAFGLVMGAVIGLPQGSIRTALQGSAVAMITACLVIAVVLPFAIFASVGRGYLLPMGMVVVALMMANLVAVLGWGAYFPWAVPGLYAQGKGDLAPISYWIVILTGLAGMLGTHLWWKYADQNR